MIYSFFKFRFTQLCRILSDLGIIRISVLLILLVFGLTYLYKKNDEYITLVIFSLLLITIQNRRKDKEIFKYLYNKNSTFIIYLEYAIVAIPFISIHIFNRHIYLLPIYAFLILVIPFFFNFQVSIPPIKTPFFRKGSYEYIIFFRRNIVYILFIYAISLLGIYNGNERILFVFTIVFYILLFFSLLYRENDMYIRMYTSSSYLLKSKCINILYNTTILFVPFFIFGFQHLHIIITIYLIGLLTIICTQCIKYIFNSQIVVGIYSFFGLLPVAVICGMYPILSFAYLLICVFLGLKANSVIKNEYFRNK
ncbi:MAG: hypothetical protein RL662_1992 [Bacteroidota bacterium]|jgi:hypothetical protein